MSKNKDRPTLVPPKEDLEKSAYCTIDEVSLFGGNAGYGLLGGGSREGVVVWSHPPLLCHVWALSVGSGWRSCFWISGAGSVSACPFLSLATEFSRDGKGRERWTAVALTPRALEPHQSRGSGLTPLRARCSYAALAGAHADWQPVSSSPRLCGTAKVLVGGLHPLCPVPGSATRLVRVN